MSSFFENFDYNSLDPIDTPSIDPPFSPNILLNDSIPSSPNQFCQEHNSFYFSNHNPFDSSEKSFDDPNDFLPFQAENTILVENENNDINIDKDINIIKEKEKKKEDNDIINKNKIIGKKKPRKHDKTARDNIKRKIQVNYIKFLKNLLNQINYELLCNYENSEKFKFFPLNSKFMKLVTKKDLDSLKEQTLGDIFKNNVSHKFKNYQNLNVQVYNEITDKSKVIKNILDKTYLEFFDVYYLNKKTLNLSKYGSDKTIYLSSNIGFYKDLLKKDDSDLECSTEDDMNYQKKIEKCIKSDFMVSDKPIFFVE